MVKGGVATVLRQRRKGRENRAIGTIKEKRKEEERKSCVHSCVHTHRQSSSEQRAVQSTCVT